MRSACSVSIAHSANPPPPSGSAGSSGLATTDLALATVTRMKRRNSDTTTLCLFAFYSDNVVAALSSSETTEPIIQRCSVARSNTNGKSLALYAYADRSTCRCNVLRDDWIPLSPHQILIIAHE